MRTIRLAIALALVLALPAAAFATSKEEAQKKMDDAKAKGCEAAKKYVLAQKDSCPDEAKAAETITCSASTYADAQKLNHQCSEKLKAGAKAAGDKAKAEKSTPAKGDSSLQSCQGVGMDGLVLAEATGSYSDCANAVRDAIKKAKCDGKTKSIQYNFVRGMNSIVSHAYCDK